MNRSGPPRAGSRGFLLLEVLLAMSLLAIGLFAIIEGLNRCIAAARSVQCYTMADRLLAERSYYFRVEQPADTDNERGTFDNAPGYTWDRTLEQPVDTPGLLQQTITVSWQERGQTMTDSIVEYRYVEAAAP